ncbi:MAG: methyltransferase FkbM family [Pedosphaera sp.]|nr:methyltransferase FkbM family [Pedosphaera sp.]
MDLAIKCSALQSGYSTPIIASRRGRRLELDLNSHIERIIYYQNAYETWDTLFLESIVQPGWIMFDVGVNIGWHSLMASKKIGSNGKIFAFDISPDEMKKLKRNIELNQLACIEPILLAMSDRPGKVSISETRDSGRTSLAVGGQRGKEIEATSLDHFVTQRNISRLDIIKVNIEGAEVKFLSGGRQTLKQFQPIIVMEFNPGALKVFGHDVQAPADLLKDHGYQLFKAHRHGLIPLMHLPTGKEYLNVIALPKRLMKRGSSLKWRAIAELGATAPR